MIDGAHTATLALTQRLVLEYSGALAAGSIIRLVARARADLSRGRMGPPSIDLLETVVRHRLTERLGLGGRGG